MKQLVTEFMRKYMKLAEADPDKEEKPVFCIRKAHFDEGDAESTFGKTWRTFANERLCCMCMETVIVHDIFKNSRTVVCHQCMPQFIDAFLKKKAKVD